jgi:hypothetical protein
MLSEIECETALRPQWRQSARGKHIAVEIEALDGLLEGFVRHDVLKNPVRLKSGSAEFMRLGIAAPTRLLHCPRAAPLAQP